jgi:DNA polymerase-3 subunit epsilon
MREIVLDTETTGLSPAEGHRIVEIGAIELVNHIPSGRTFHAYLNPEREVPAEALAVHGLSTEFLRGKTVFGAVAEQFLTFIDGAMLVIHNAAFDIGFLNAELGRLGHVQIQNERTLDTMALARQKHPLGPNSLDALCRRYNVDNSSREKHGALLDAELLADVYVELIGGRQPLLVLVGKASSAPGIRADRHLVSRPRPEPLPSRLTAAEAEAHRQFVSRLGRDPVWKRWLG